MGIYVEERNMNYQKLAINYSQIVVYRFKLTFLLILIIRGDLIRVILLQPSYCRTIAASL